LAGKRIGPFDISRVKELSAIGLAYCKKEDLQEVRKHEKSEQIGGRFLTVFQCPLTVSKEPRFRQGHLFLWDGGGGGCQSDKNWVS